jgi:hypothetical protein
MIELSNKERRSLSQQEKNGSALPSDSKLFDLFPLRAPSYSEKSVFDFELNGTTYTPKNGSCWITSKEKMEYLKSINRLYAQGKDIFYVQYLEDFPYKKLSNLWLDSRQTEKIYVVQTATKILEKCILMTSNPGDIILDSFAGSGATAHAVMKMNRQDGGNRQCCGQCASHFPVKKNRPTRSPPRLQNTVYSQAACRTESPEASPPESGECGSQNVLRLNLRTFWQFQGGSGPFCRIYCSNEGYYCWGSIAGCRGGSVFWLSEFFSKTNRYKYDPNSFRLDFV